jgi:hypothetical protein
MIRLMIVAAAVVALTMCAPPAFAHDPYGSWKIPGTNTSCCDHRDCRPARARMDENERWEAWDGQRWIKVPPDRVLKIPSPDGRSHLCELHGAVLCFVPAGPKS